MACIYEFLSGYFNSRPENIDVALVRFTVNEEFDKIMKIKMLLV